MSFLRHRQNRLIRLRAIALSLPYLINIFLISCSPAELIYASIDTGKCKPILGLKIKCKFVSGLTVNLKNNCKLFLGRVNL